MRSKLFCDGKTYIRRVDLATGTIADFLYPTGMGDAVQSYAYLAP